jgi:hypothetical protein
MALEEKTEQLEKVKNLAKKAVVIGLVAWNAYAGFNTFSNSSKEIKSFARAFTNERYSYFNLKRFSLVAEYIITIPGKMAGYMASCGYQELSHKTDKKIKKN